MKRFFIGCVIFFVCFSCSKEEHSPAMVWADYYPLSIGSVRIYECTSITIDVLAEINDTSVYTIKETVVSSLKKGNTYEVFAENCEKRTSDTSGWIPHVSLGVQCYDHSIVRVEDNVPYQVLKFPVNTLFSWNLNEFNTQDEQKVSYSSINQTDTINGVIYDSVLFVMQKNFKSLYTYEYGEERYAKNVGLIYKKTIDVESQPTQMQIDLTKPIEDRITKGTILTYKLIQSSIK